MTIITTQSRITYAGDGVTTAFPIPFEFFLNTDITAVKTAVGGGVTTLVQSVDYVLFNAAVPSGGTLFKTVPLLVGETMAIFLNPPIEQESHYPANNPFPASTLENDLDRQTQISQRLSDILSRSLRAPDGDPTVSTIGFLLPSYLQRANTALGFDVNGNPLPIQSIPAGTLSAATIGGFIGPQTAAEANAGVAVVFPWIPSGNVLRYGVVPNSSGAAASNATILQALFNAAVGSGPTGQFYFPNTTGSDVYSIAFASGGCITVRDGCKIDLQGCTLALSGTGVAADSNSGFFFAIRDFEIKNGTMNVTWATGTLSSSAGNAVALGARGADSARWPVAIWDSLLPTPMGNCRLANLRIKMIVTGANLSSASAISLCGGIQGLIIENVYIDGNGTLPAGIVQEFGWATSDSQPSARQSSHMHNFTYRNIQISNMDNAASTSSGLVFAAAYQGLIENYSFSGVSNGATSSTGESMFYRPWAGIDDIAGKHSLHFRNLTGTGVSNAGLNLSGITSLAGTGYLRRPWVTATVYGVRETVVNGGNMYVCTVGGTSGAGPSGTGTGIVDGTVTWNYVPLTANTDQIDYVVENFDCTGTISAAGILTSAGYINVRNCNFSGMTDGIFLFAECTRFDIDGVRSFGAQSAGFEMATAAGAIWSPIRLKKGTVRNCYVYGNSISSAGSFPGINLNNCQGVLIENNRINADAAYNGVADTTQGCGVQVSTNGFGVVCRNNHVGTVIGGGNAAYASLAGTGAINGNDIVSPSGTITQVGPWNNDGTGNASSANLALKTANINTIGKQFGRRCINSSNNRLLTASGPLNTDVWTYCDGNAPGTITPV